MTLLLSGTDGLSDVDGSAATPAIRGTDANTGIFFPAADTIAFSEGGVESMRLDSSGNVGIGTSSPAKKLEVRGTDAAARFRGSSIQYLDITATSGGTVNLDANNGDFAVSVNNVERMRIDGSGNVGIGTTSPAYDLQVGSYGVDADSTLALASTTSGTGSIRFGDGTSGTDANAGLLRYDHSANAMIFWTNTTERMRIDSSGKLLVGTTSNSGLTGGMGCPEGYGMNRNLTDQAGRRNWSLVSESAAVGDCCLLSSTTNTAGPNTVRLQVTSAGSCFNSTGTYGTFSDIKLKENIVDTTPKLEKLLQVRVVNYNRIGESNKELGVIAQELENIFPNMVEESTDLEDGQVTSTTTKAVKYSVFVPMLIKAIQEQQALIQQLQADVAALKGV